MKIAAQSKASFMHMIVRAAMQPLPAFSTANWVKANPVQKLEQLCMMLVMARAEKAPVAVLFSTSAVAEYIRALLKQLEEQQYFLFGALLGITSGMTWPQVSFVRQFSSASLTSSIREMSSVGINTVIDAESLMQWLCSAQ